MVIPNLTLFHKATTMKYYNISFGIIMQDENEDPEQVAQLLNEVLAVVAPSNIAVSYSVYMAPCYGDDDEVEAYKVHSLIKVVDPNRFRPSFTHGWKRYLRSGVCTAHLDGEI